MRKNSLSGSFPSGWDDHLYFSSLDVAENSMTGALPAMLGLASLTEFSVSHNDFTFTSFDDYLYDEGSVPNNLKSLKIASLLGASCSNPFPTKLANYSTLQIVDLSGNQFSGSLDSTVQSLDKCCRTELGRQ